MTMTKDYDENLQKEVEGPISKRLEIVNRRGRTIVPRRYHMTSKQISNLQGHFLEDTKDISIALKELAGDKFFNPFRRAGIYYGCVQSLYLLGSNEWHEFRTVRDKIQHIMSTIKNNKNIDVWTVFQNKSCRNNITGKDEEGRIIQNFKVMQRLGGVNPYGYKLAQVNTCIDIMRKKDSRYFLKLNTNWSTVDITPIYDISEFPGKKRGKKILETV